MSEEMRKEFEDLVVSGDLIPDLFDKCVMRKSRVEMMSNCFYNNRYHDDALQSGFDAFKSGWRASREAMKPIKLPNLPSVHDGYTKHEIDFMSYAIDECKEAIQQAGYKVEE